MRPSRLAALALGAAGCTVLSSLDDLKGGRISSDSGGDVSTGTGGGPKESGADSADGPACDAKTSSDPNNCGECGSVCPANQVCQAGQCKSCESATDDCDLDGWLVSEGDCCDKAGACGQNPDLVNPGAIEISGNGIDDNCNGLTDLFDVEDTVACDAGLYSNSAAAENYARALGICRTTEATPTAKKEKTWGLIKATLSRADGTPLEDLRARSIRTSFGALNPNVTEGEAVVVLSTGIASDAVQTDPGPNGGAPAGYNVTNAHTPVSNVDVATCTDLACISDWFQSENLPLKEKGKLPTAPGCASDAGSVVTPEQVFDSVMLTLEIRAPTNSRAFSFNTYFLSAEYPEYVCSDFNDQFVALVDTRSGTPSPIPNPTDKNLLTYAEGGKKWPVGINIAHGTSLFAVCETETANPTCWDTDVDSKSCSLGALQLAGTGFEKGSTNPCLFGGGTHWLTAGGNVIPGENVVIRIVLWDVGDAFYDSTALIDGFKWLPDPIEPGTR